MVVHYDGTSWHRFGFPSSTDLDGIKAVNATTVWAVGQATDLSSYIVRWDGISWARESTPGAGPSDSLLGIATPSSSSAFAVGETIYGAHKIRTLALKCCS